jgi:SAM-dependent methyltransferase
MLAPKEIPERYREWNRRQGAPNGHRRARRGPLRRPDLWWKVPAIVGPFGFQANSATRAFEYPWAFDVVPHRGARCLDIGGSLAGFQFALDRDGATVTNVDPGERAHGLGWPVTTAAIAHLNHAFRTDVTLVPTTLQEADIPSASVDVVYSISTIEHIPADELPLLFEEIARVLRPGGACVMTVDLFLNLTPFSDRADNEFGTNVSVRDLVEFSGLALGHGDPAELLGFPEFDERRILADLERYLCGEYPVLAQCFTLHKPTG